MHRSRVLAPLLLAAALAVSACGTDTAEPGSAPAAAATAASPSPDAATPSSTATPSATASSAGGGGSSSAPTPGAYLTKAEYESQMASREGTKVVLFFHASWCPSCRATEEAIAESGVPGGLTVVKVDFDEETDLRREYGVTQQHTFVQIDPDGGELAKWTGSENGAAILAETV